MRLLIYVKRRTKRISFHASTFVSTLLPHVTLQINEQRVELNPVG